jgi:RNA polymerase sigma-70 factor (ECF subfamily)
MGIKKPWTRSGPRLVALGLAALPPSRQLEAGTDLPSTSPLIGVVFGGAMRALQVRSIAFFWFLRWWFGGRTAWRTSDSHVLPPRESTARWRPVSRLRGGRYGDGGQPRNVLGCSGILFSVEATPKVDATQPDLTVVALAKRGDKDAFTTLVSTFGPEVMRLCSVMLRDRESAQDAAQATWAQAWQHLGSLREESRIRAWLLRIAVNESRQMTRRRLREVDRLATLSASQSGRRADDGVDELRDALGRLASKDRELLAYRYAIGFTASEISRSMNLSPEGVRSRLKRLRDHLRKELADE